MQKNNITLSFKNIISFLNNLTGHFAGVQKIITLSLTILMLNFTNITLSFSNNSISALSYQSEIGIGFTFNPTLSISLSSSDLVIPNLTPGSSNDSNSINVSVATNASYGYTLSVSSSSDNLIHSNNTNTFNGIATDADLASLTADNTWGYSTKLPNEANWSNYNGLSSSTNTTLIDNSNTADSTGSIDFKIGARAGSTQASGIYTNTINFIAVSKVAPMSLLDSFIASGAEQYNGYFKMQDMTHDICNNVDIEESELQLIDIRDNKIYWVAKLKDGNCWMTQNLDLDLSSNVALISETSDIDPESYGTTIYTSETGYIKDETTGIVSWLPERSTYVSTSEPGPENWAGNTGSDSTSGYYHPYSWNRISNDNGGPVYPDSLVTKAVAGSHAQSGNYYNWSAAIASNNSLNATGSQNNSICPKGWRLPVNGKYGALYNVYKTTDNSLNNAYGLLANPLWFVRSGDVNNSGSLTDSGYGRYWSSTATNNSVTTSHRLGLNSSSVGGGTPQDRFYGLSLRCLARW